MSGSYRIGIEVGRRALALAAQVARVRDRAWLALLDLDEALEARVSAVEERLAEVRQGAEDARSSRDDKGCDGPARP